MLRTAITISRARVLQPRRLPRFPPCRNLSSTPPRLQNRYIRFDEEPKHFSDPHSNKGGSKQARSRLTTYVGAGIGLAGGFYYINHLEQVPQTGRWRFMNLGPHWDTQIGEETRRQMLQEYGNKVLPANHPVSRQVRRVVTRILDANKLGSIKGEAPLPSAFGQDTWNPHETIRNAPSREWNVIVVNDSKVVNAAATPGTIVVFTGILPVCRDDDGLAAVLSHEVGHVVARHTAERASSATLAFIAIFVISNLIGVDFGLSNMVHSLLFELPNSRKQELEADTIGMTLMSRACYDPKGAPEMFRRLGELEKKMGSSSLSFLNTHPATGSRVEALEKILPEAYATLAANPDCSGVSDSFQRFRAAGILGGFGDRDVWA